jgi:hypothetical protein
MDTKNLSIIRQSFANTVFTHKVQEIAVENKENRSFYIKIINIVLVSVVLVLLLVQAYYPEEVIISSLASGVTIAEIIFLIIQLFFNLDQQVIHHKNSALEYMGLRDEYKSLIADIMSNNVSNKNLLDKRDSLQNKYLSIGKLSPQTGRKEYERAQIRLNKIVVEGEDFTWSEKEINRFLPERLKL